MPEDRNPPARTATGRGAAASPQVAPRSTAHPTIAMLRSASLASAAQQEIEHLILAGALLPGTKLTEAWLSERLGISRGPIREAFRRLEENGLVRQEKNRGVFVREIPVDEAVEIYDLRAVMDELIGRRLAASISADQLKQARALADQMEQAARRNDADAYHALNLQFHDALVEFTGNRKLAAVYRKLVKELALFRRRNFNDRSVLPHSAAEHRQILKAIAAGDAELAGRSMYEHVIESKERMLRIANEQAQPAARGAVQRAARKERA
jgi:phosphonate utilization transcriptional regulator